MIKRVIKNLIHNRGFVITRPYKNRPRDVQKELNRLKTLEKGCETVTSILGKPIQIPCPHTFEYIYSEICERGIYNFPSLNNANYIIDAGANIGLATLFFKNLNPKLKIVAVEADPGIAEMLRNNLSTFGYSDVDVINAAVAGEKKEIRFISDKGGTGGHIAKGDTGQKIGTVLLSDLINDPTDFLKLDIEGAEFEAISESIDKLNRINYMFIEYHSRVGLPQRLSCITTALENTGFRYLIEQGSEMAAQPFMETKTHKNLDNYLNIYAKNSVRNQL